LRKNNEIIKKGNNKHDDIKTHGKYLSNRILKNKNRFE
jgi:hypothetical protein